MDDLTFPPFMDTLNYSPIDSWLHRNGGEMGRWRLKDWNPGKLEAFVTHVKNNMGMKESWRVCLLQTVFWKKWWTMRLFPILDLKLICHKVSYTVQDVWFHLLEISKYNPVIKDGNIEQQNSYMTLQMAFWHFKENYTSLMSTGLKGDAWSMTRPLY